MIKISSFLLSVISGIFQWMEFWCLFLPQTFRVRINLSAQRTYRDTTVFGERLQIQVSHSDCKFWDQKVHTVAGGHSPWIYESIDSLELPKKGILVTISDNTETQLSEFWVGKAWVGHKEWGQYSLVTAAHGSSWEPTWSILVETPDISVSCACVRVSGDGKGYDLFSAVAPGLVEDTRIYL